MEKYGVEIDPQKQGLLQEEARLMQEMQQLMTSNEKTAEEMNRESSLQGQLSSIRSKITELDLGKKM